MHDHDDTSGAPDLERAIDSLWAGYATATYVTRGSCTDDLLDLMNLAASRTVRVEIERALGVVGARRLLTGAEACGILTGVSAALNVDDAYGHLPFGPTVHEPA